MALPENIPVKLPSKLPAILGAGIVAIVLVTGWVLLGVKGGIIPGLINFALIVGTYRAIRNAQLKRN